MTKRHRLMGTGISKADADKILDADFANIVRKVREGKTLSSGERARVQAQAAGSTETLAVARNLVELSNALGVTRRTLSNWRKMKGAPQPAANGSHSVTEWRDFVRANDLKCGSDTTGLQTEALKARKLLAEVEERELKVAVRKGEVVSTDLVRRHWLTLVGKAISLMRAKFENELPPIMSGMDAQGIRMEAAKAIDEVCAMLHEGGGAVRS